MTEHLLFLIVGLGAGAAYAGVAMGIVTTYRGTGVINIAQGAMAMWPAFVFDELQRTGTLVLPAGRVDIRPLLGDDIGPWAALAVATASAALLGLVVHLLVFRPLRRAPALARVVASVGVTIVLQALVVLQFGTGRRAVPSMLTDQTVEIGSLRFAEDRLWLAGLAIVVATALWAFGRFTRTGLATRAAAQDERGAVLMGFSPDRLAAVTWVLSAVLGGAAAILTAPTVGLEPVHWTLVVVPALACALAGRLTSIGMAAAAGLALGAVESEITLLSTRDWWPGWASVGVAQSLPLVVIAIVLFVTGDRLPTRGSLRADPLPPVVPARPRPVLVAALVAGGAAAVLLTSGSHRFGVITSMIVAVLALSLVVLTGLVGQLSLATAAFAGTAGFALSKIGDGLPFPLSLLAASLVATAVGVAVGLPALRVRGVQLAVVTLASAVAVQELVFENPRLAGRAGNMIPDPSVAGLDLGVRQADDLARAPFGLFVLAVLTLAALAVSNLARSATGRRLLAVRSNERAAAAAGVDVARVKLLAFAISSFLAGVGGCLLGYSRGQLSAESFGVTVGLSLLAFAYLGGITSVGGALVAGTLAPLGIGYVVLDRTFELGRHYLLVSGLLLVATAVLNPAGVAGRVGSAARAVRLPRTTGRRLPVPASLTQGAGP
ncbi:MAG TPA: ABC transporter permease [Acidimicrobiales bacterium]|nr:ABC transporter permease [Acidimicrobiales bacterium]